MNINYSVILEQKQKLHHSQIQSLKILALDNCELNDFLQTEYIENPMIEYSKNYDLPSWNHSSSHFLDDDENYREIPDQKTNGIKEYLLDQLNRNDYSSLQWDIFQILIDCLDNHGYFTLSINDISLWLSIDISTVRYCLNVLSSLEPCGIFSKDLSDCLITQLEKRKALTPTLKDIIRYHLDDVASGRINKISKIYSLSTREVRNAIDLIRTLNPRPLSCFNTETTTFIVPDIILSIDNGEGLFQLNDKWIGNYSISDCYLNMMKNTQSHDLKAYFEEKYNRCQFIMNSIEQRRNTILKIAYAIFEKQKAYFLCQEALLPMTLTEIGDMIHMHPSTVSRAIKNKYLQFPSGTVLLKDLFTSAATKNSFDSSESVKRRIQTLINEENPKSPFSDSVLVSLLKQENVTISRRTVAKYREELGIQSTYLRKQAF